MYENDRILFVDDDVALLRAISRGLEEKFDLITAKSGMEALKILENDGPFSVVVSDVKMPQMDGIELVRQIRERWSEVVCIILTGNQDEDTAQRAHDIAKVFRMLNKPSQRSELVAAIEDALELFHSPK